MPPQTVAWSIPLYAQLPAQHCRYAEEVGLPPQACTSCSYDPDEIAARLPPETAATLSTSERRAIESMRRRGMAVVVFTPDDFYAADPVVVEAKVIEAGTEQIIEMLAPGVDLFDVDSTGMLEIERVDDIGMFDGDEDAISFVEKCYERGLKWAADMLNEHAKHANALIEYRRKRDAT